MEQLGTCFNLESLHIRSSRCDGTWKPYEPVPTPAEPVAGETMKGVCFVCAAIAPLRKAVNNTYICESCQDAAIQCGVEPVAAETKQREGETLAEWVARVGSETVSQIIANQYERYVVSRPVPTVAAPSPMTAYQYCPHGNLPPCVFCAPAVAAPAEGNEWVNMKCTGDIETSAGTIPAKLRQAVEVYIRASAPPPAATVQMTAQEFYERLPIGPIKDYICGEYDGAPEYARLRIFQFAEAYARYINARS